jgi:hypothetical protein
MDAVRAKLNEAVAIDPSPQARPLHHFFPLYRQLNLIEKWYN